MDINYIDVIGYDPDELVEVEKIPKNHSFI